jgi:arsenate reductase
MDRKVPYNVLFLCTGNSARSIMAEALLNFWGRGRFHAFSAGSHPKGEVHPLTIETLARSHLPVEGARSKSWNEFSTAQVPKLDFVFTVCGNAAKEQCPVWPGQPMTAHWGVDDPAAVEGTPQEQRRAFERALRELDARIKLFISLPLESLDQLALQERLHEIGRTASTKERDDGVRSERMNVVKHLRRVPVAKLCREDLDLSRVGIRDGAVAARA